MKMPMYEDLGKVLGMVKETGLMVISTKKSDCVGTKLGWGVIYPAGHGYGESYGWVNPSKAELHKHATFTSPLAITSPNSQYFDELKTGVVVKVTRKIIVEIE